MDLNDILNNPEADEELRQRDKPKKKVPVEDYKGYVQERLREACSQVGSGRVDEQYTRAVAAVKELSVVPDAQDISDFCARNVELQPITLGVFVTALVNTVKELETPVRLAIAKGVTLDYFGYRLARDVVIRGDLSDHTAYMMEQRSLTVEGNCHGVVGELMGKAQRLPGPTVDVRGSIRDGADFKYSGTIMAGKNLRNYYTFRSRYDLEQTLNRVNLFPDVTMAIRMDGIIPLHPDMKHMLNSQLVAIACNHNIKVYESERNSWADTLGREEREYNELVNQWNAICPKYEHAKKEAIGTGILNGVALLTPFAPLVLMSGLFTLFTGIDTFTLGGDLKKLQLELQL